MDDTFFDDFFEKYILSNAPDCNTFRINLIKFVTNLNTMDASQFTRGKYQDAHNSIPIIKLYDDHRVILINKYFILGNDGEVIRRLENAAIMYLALTIFKNYGSNIKAAKKSLKKVETAVRNLLKVIDGIDLEQKFLFSLAFSIDDFSNLLKARNSGEIDKKYLEAFSNKDISDSIPDIFFISRALKIRKQLNHYTNIYERFTETKLGKSFQIAKSGPKENIALSEWIDELAKLWVIELKRDLSYSSDKASGREQFLQFAEDCMEPLHAELFGTDKIRNAYEKLRQNGKFDYLVQNMS